VHACFLALLPVRPLLPQPILVEEPSPADCLELLEGLAPRYETFHGVSLPHDTLATAVAAAQRRAWLLHKPGAAGAAACSLSVEWRAARPRVMVVRLLFNTPPE
jgi:hypothetical protein